MSSIIVYFPLDYLRHAPCMRQVQSGYERCASEYQHRIKSLNSGAGGNNEYFFNGKLACRIHLTYLFCRYYLILSHNLI